MSELPDGWAYTTLGEVCSKPQYGHTSAATRTGRVKYVRTTDISGGEIEWSSVPFCLQEPTDLEKYRVRSDDILVSRAGSVGISTRVDACPHEAVFASYLIRFCTSDGVLPKYVEFFLKSDGYWRSISESSAGIAVPNVNASKLSEIPLPLAPTNEQVRIVARLGSVLNNLAACQQRLERIPILLKRFRQSVLAAACSGKLTEDWRANDGISELPEGWCWKRLTDLLPPKGGVFDGPFGSNLKTDDYTNAGVRVVRLENVGPLRFFDDKRTYISKNKYESLRKHTVREGDIIFSSFISDEMRVCMLPRLGELAIAKADCFCIRPLSEVISPNYLLLQLACDTTLTALMASVHGATRPRVNISQLKELTIRTCPRDEQETIVSRATQLFELADQIEARFQKAKAQIDKLTPAILSKAFRGELVPQDPNDEPADKLLERICAAKASATNESMGRGRTKRSEEKPLVRRHKLAEATESLRATVSAKPKGSRNRGSIRKRTRKQSPVK